MMHSPVQTQAMSGNPPFPSHLDGMSSSSFPAREVTPTYPIMQTNTPDQLDFDSNADFPDYPNLASDPVNWEEFDPQPCDRLQQRVLDVATNTFYKAPMVLLPHHAADRAYWIQQSIRKAIFGQVWIGQVLKRPDETFDRATGHANPDVITHWETTGQCVAIKQLSKQTMGQIAALTAENPRREVAAMHHAYLVSTAAQWTPSEAMQRTGVMMPQDWLQDEHYCYSIMPYCDGGELFDRVGSQGRFTEDEARHWMHQILNSLEALHSTGVAHRDLSLENIMIHKDRAVIIDLGMSVQIPYDMQRKMRSLIRPQGQAGKQKYMAPEVYANQEAFDGFAIDMWAVGVILYIMLIGEFPWEMPHPADEKFRYITDGYLEDYLRRRGFPLSPDVLCLLQRMLWLNPRHRLCLQQVRAHPWMAQGDVSAMAINAIPFRSATRGADGEEEDVSSLKKEEIKIVPPDEIQPGRYTGKDDGIPSEDMEAMLEKVEPYQRRELRPEEEMATVEPTVLSDDDPYVQAQRAKMAQAERSSKGKNSGSILSKGQQWVKKLLVPSSSLKA